MEEEEHPKAMDLKRPRKLDFNKPLLSTKRLSIVVADTSCSNYNSVKNTSDERVPFSWEKSAGKPKDVRRVSHDRNEEETPRLRLPPCLWHHQPNKEAYVDNNGDDVDDGDDGDDGDGDGNDLAVSHGNYDDEKFDSDVLSDAMEVFSLSEALDIVQKSENARRESRNEGLILKLQEESNNGSHSPSYLIKRFLPDATALAASSALQFSNNKICDSSNGYLDAYVASSPKGCGLEALFPWRLKHKLCALKSPILPCSSATNMQKQQNSSEQKKHQRMSSQAVYKM